MRMGEKLYEAYLDSRWLIDRQYVPTTSRFSRYGLSNLLHILSNALLVAAVGIRRIERRLGQILASSATTSGPVRLHLGCGRKRIDGYINIDGVMTEAADRVMNILDLDFPPNTVDEIYSSHMIEHLSPQELEIALSNWFAILKPGGILTIRCPNFEYTLRLFLDTPEPERWDKTTLPTGVVVTPFNMIFGSMEGPFQYHKNAFTSAHLRSILEEHGFDVVKCHPCPNRGNTIENHDLFCVAQKPHQRQPQ